MENILLIAGMSDPVIADYATWAVRSRKQRVTVIANPDVCGRIKECVEMHSAEAFSKTDYLAAHPHDRPTRMVIFISRKSTRRDQELLRTVADIAIATQVNCICIVSSFRVHLGDRSAMRAEGFLVDRLKGLPTRIVIFRPSHILSPRSRMNEFLGKWGVVAPLVPLRCTTCFVGAEELFAAIQQELERCGGRKRCTYTILGANSPWKTLLKRKRDEHRRRAFVSAIDTILQFLLIEKIVGLLVGLVMKWFSMVRPYIFDTLYPTSVEELLALYNRYNYQNVKIVGYNNGVIHFGHSYPGKTIISTVRCNHTVRIQGSIALFDGGVTLRRAMEELKREGKELYVVPNYSYVSMGTSYFIPIHGSASSYSTIGETIEKVLLYDPSTERFIAATRKDAEFGQYMYNLAAEVILLRLTVRVSEKARYFRRVLELKNSSSDDILKYFHDDKPSNVEVRKARASSEVVRVSLYYREHEKGDTEALALPRDTLGSLWDRLESNPITSVLFHSLIRRLAHHVELFLSEKDFAIFWDTHRTLPLSKIQLRFIKRDGMPQSPFRQHDCVSADLFMLKKHKKAFQSYLKETLPAAGMNPGKHSR